MTKALGSQRLSLALRAPRALEYAEFPSEFPAQGNFAWGDPLGRDCVIHHTNNASAWPNRYLERPTTGLEADITTGKGFALATLSGHRIS